MNMTIQSNENFSLDYFDLAVLEEDLYYEDNALANYFFETVINFRLYKTDKVLKKGSYVLILAFSVRQNIAENDINNNFVLKELIAPIFYINEKLFVFMQIGTQPI